MAYSYTAKFYVSKNEDIVKKYSILETHGIKLRLAT